MVKKKPGGKRGKSAKRFLIFPIWGIFQPSNEYILLDFVIYPCNACFSHVLPLNAKRTKLFLLVPVSNAVLT